MVDKTKYSSWDEARKAAKSASSLAKYYDYQEETADTAHNKGRYWTEEEDIVLLKGEGTIRDKARQLERSFAGCVSRLARIRHLMERGQVHYYEGDYVADVPSSSKSSRVLCPCGASDGDHDEWCPEKVQ